jgi:amino acid adenylation domain-containing protein
MRTMKCIHELFEDQTALTPGAIALDFEADRLTYRELNRRADALAGRLLAMGVGPGRLAAIFLDRSPDMVIGMLGVLKAGGAYVPLDPTLPEKRLAYMLADAEPLIVLTQKNLQSRLPLHDVQAVMMDDISVPAAPEASPGRKALPEDLAYVIYTSGSTGQPKGVEIQHKAVANMLASMQRRPGISPADRMLALTTMAFDISVLEIFLPLSCGACMVLAGSEAVRDGAALISLIEQSGVTVMQATPATLQMLLDAGWEGGDYLKILCGGEAWNAGLAGQLLARCGSLWNMYGPTETTVWSAVARVEEGRSVVVGRPIANTRFYVLDSNSQLVPVGVPGELYIAGEGLARGYLHRPELTAERFIADPFAGSGALMYRTGDLVKRLQNGTLEFLGRLDHQVKIRGHRIELGEIESALTGHPDIERCVAIAYQGVDGLQNLAAYFIPTSDKIIPVHELRLFLGDRLPSYMIPAAYVPIPEFPLTPSGKLDRKALPPPETRAPEIGTEFVEPVMPVEKQLAAIWREMLNLAQVGLRDNFFDLGGHSLLALRTINEINKALNVRLNVPDFFQGPTIEQLVKMLDLDNPAKNMSRIVELQRGHAGLPVYFIGARPDEYRLAQLIGKDRSIFLIDAMIPTKWVDAAAAQDRKALPTMEELGELYGRMLSAHIGTAPCVVAGYSLGGKIAFEAAQTLRRAGGAAELVLLIDARALAWTGMRKIATALRSGWMALGNTVFKAGTGIPFTQRVSRVLQNFWHFARWQIGSIPTAVHYRLDVIRYRKAVEKNAPPADKPSGYFDSEGKPIGMWIVYRLAKLVGQSWRPQPLDTMGAMIRATSDVDMLPGYDRAHGWRGLFRRGFELVQGEGDHLSILTSEHALSFSRQINALLDRYGSVPKGVIDSAVETSSSGPAAEQKRFGLVPSSGPVRKDLGIYVPAAGGS